MSHAAVISANANVQNVQEEDLVLAKIFEEILSEKLDEIFKQRVVSSPVPFDLRDIKPEYFQS